MKLLTMTPVYNFEQPDDDFGDIPVEFFNSPQTKRLLVSLYVRDSQESHDIFKNLTSYMAE